METTALTQMAVRNLCKLPNGKEIVYKSRPETAQFYADIFEKQIYMRNGVKLPSGGVVFDVGANIGLFSLFAAQFSGVRIFAFEPAPEIFRLLQENVERHGVPARLFNCGLGARSESRGLTYYPRSSGLSSFYGNQEEECASLRAVLSQSMRSLSREDREELSENMDALIESRLLKQIVPCEIQKLSSIIRQYEVSQIDLLKVDVQKSELDVLLGIDADHWVKVKQIAMEVQDGGGRLQGILSLLADRGYQVSVEQDELYSESTHYNVYGRATSAGS